MNLFPVMYGGGAPSEDLSPVLLWTNPSPTSAFTPQTISLDLSEYAGVIVKTKRGKNDSNIDCEAYARIGETRVSGASVTYSNGRPFIVSSTGVEFKSANFNGTVDNDDNIPVNIYGVKRYVVEPVPVLTIDDWKVEGYTNSNTEGTYAIGFLSLNTEQFTRLTIDSITGDYMTQTGTNFVAHVTLTENGATRNVDIPYTGIDLDISNAEKIKILNGTSTGTQGASKNLKNPTIHFNNIKLYR